MRMILALVLIAVLSPMAQAQTYPPNITATNPADLFHVSGGPSILAARDDLNQKVFGPGGFNSTILPTFHSIVDLTGTVWIGTPNLLNVKRWDVTNSLGFSNKLYEFNPVSERQTSAGKTLVIIAGGHGQNPVDVPYTATIKGLLASGVRVMAVAMPLDGVNPSPVVVDVPGVGKLRLGTHDMLWATKTPEFEPLRLFMEPFASVVNKYTADGYSNIAMFGLSGGGWASTVYPALDPRVDASYALAGSLPMYARSKAPPTGALGDAEQYMITSLGYDYLDLYALGSVGAGRYHVNIHIVLDNCCFAGTVAQHYRSAVQAVVNGSGLGGTYQTLFDYTVNTHTVSPYIDSWVRTDILSRF